MSEDISLITDAPAADNAGHDTFPETEKRFTQQELDRLLSERLKRERQNNAHLKQIKTALDTLRSEGKLKSSAYSDLAAELLARYPDTEKPSEPITHVPLPFTHTDGESAPESPLPTPDAAVAQPDGDKPVTSTSEQGGTAKDDAISRITLEELYALAARFPDEAVAADMMTDGFRAFSEGRSGSPEALYAAYLRVKHALRADVPHETGTEAPQNENRGSSAFRTDVLGDVYPQLTKRQMELARDNGMSLREYASLLASVPRGKRG